jgi:outer membrane murein-binding lipoprotein Lpp
MPRLLLSALLLLIPLTATAVDDLRVNQLEQEVRDLKRQVQTLTRQVDELRNHPARLNSRRGLATAPGSSASSDWVDLSKWNRLRPGMSEMEVLSALGPPTTMRDADGAKVLRYALEISSGGFLSGSVTLRDRVVVEVRKPELQ